MTSRNRHSRWIIALGVLVGAAVFLALLATSPRPWVDQPRTPTAEQVEAARVLFRQARESRALGRAAQLAADQNELTSVAALVSQGFAPYRAKAELNRGVLRLTASRPVLFRWVNVRIEMSGRSEGFPPLKLTIGALTFPPWLSGPAIEMARLTLRARGAEVPPLDTLVRSTDVGASGVRAAIFLPKTGLIDQVAGHKELALDGATVARIYCGLARRQQAAPERLLSGQLSRALSEAVTSGPSDPARDGAALIALAMITVDTRVGELAGDAAVRAKPCIIPTPEIILRGRADLAKHWALSAALTVGTGGRFAEAMGEWKELADSLTAGPYLAADTRTGFSFVDLAADRAGYLTALGLADPARATAVRSRLAAASEDALLPRAALEFEEGLSNSQFTTRFGATDDPRYRAEVRRIDAVLSRAGIG